MSPTFVLTDTVQRRSRAWGRLSRTPLLLGGLLLLCGGAAAAQQVTGTVTSAATGRPLPGVNVTIRGTTLGTQTGANGGYSLAARSPDDTLTFSAIGYRQENVPISGRTVIDQAMQTQAVALEQLVVVGYGTQQRRDVTGAVASVSGEEIAQVATPSVEQALQGKVAGVQVTPASGKPGSGAVVRIRGVGTLNNASPLYVVDGMLLDDISFLSPNDIASLDVLKDASATAIYGSRGANGVIIVTTKKGNTGQGTTFTASAYAGAQSVLHPIDLVSAQQYAVLANELAANQGVAPYFPDAGAVGAGTDWQDDIFDTAPIQSYQLASSGGTDRVRYYFSGNYINQAGVVPKSGFERVTFRVNNDYDLAPSFRLGHNLSFSYTEDRVEPGVLGALYRADPTIAPRDAQGDFSDANVRASAGNPAATVFYTNNRLHGGRLVGNLFADLDVLRDFTFRSSFGLDYFRSDYRSFVPVFFVSPTQRNITSNLRVSTGNTSSWLWENTLTYNWRTERQRLNALVGITAQTFYQDSIGGERNNIAGASSNLWYLNAGAAEGQTNFNAAFDWRLLSYLVRTNYTLLDRYLLTASLRVDGSSRFGASNRYGWFPSLAAGWDLAQEDFMQGVPAFSQLKLRASWGQIGNDKIGAYPGIPVVTGNLSAVFGPEQTLTYGATPVELANPDVKWERTTQSNVGVDLAILQGKVAATLDAYRRMTDGILVQVPIPSYVGVESQPFVNAAEVLNSGFEATLGWNGGWRGFDFSLGANGSTLHNEVKALGGGQEEILGGGLGNEISFTTRTVVGHPIGEFWGYRVAGVFQTPEEIATSPTRGGEQPGDLRYADLNGDGTITEADKTFLGSPIPDFIYGLNAQVNWKAFDFAASFSGQAGNKVFNGKKAVRFGVENFESSYLDRWHGPGTSNREPRVTNAGHNYQASDRFLEDGSFFKLQTAQLGYRLPARLTDRLNVGEARLWVNGTNLFLLSDYSGYTPELTGGSVIASGIDLGVYPPVRTLSVGVDLRF